MTLFFFFIFFVYGGVHVYAFLKARQALGFGWAAGARSPCSCSPWSVRSS